MKQSQLATALKAVMMTRSITAICSAWREDVIVDVGAVDSDESSDESSGERTDESQVPRTYTVHEDPRVSVFPHFLSDAEVDAILSLCEGHWEASGIADSAGTYADASGNRTSCSAILDWAQTPAISKIEERVAGLAGLSVNQLEGLVGVRYMPGQFFGLHHDGRQRPVTVFIYLNDLPDDDEGETRFPMLGLRITPRRGAAVMWSNCRPDGSEDMRLCHHAVPPKTSVKYGVNCFFYEFPLRSLQDDDDACDEPGGLAEVQRWNVVLQRSAKGPRLGVVVHAHRDTLLVDKVEEGLLAEWNRAKPAQAVQVRDRIVSANGETGDADRLFEACHSEGPLTLVVQRRGSATGHT